MRPWEERRQLIHAKCLEEMAKLPTSITEHVLVARRWAKDRLMRREGEGHYIAINRKKDGRFVCSFAKPSWPGDHCGEPMDTGAKAIVISVLEYEAYEDGLYH